MRLFISLLLTLTFYFSFGQNGWINLAVFPGTPRVNAVGFVANSNTIIAGGGYRSDTAAIVLLGDFWEYNISTNTWTQINSLPLNYKIAEAQSFVMNNRGYVVGGLLDSAGGVGYQGKVFEFDLASYSWQVKNNLPSTGGAIAFGIQNQGFTVLTDLINNSIFEYDQPNDLWILKADSVASSTMNNLKSASVATDSNSAYLFGGTLPTVSNCSWLDKVYSYNRSSNTWSFLSGILNIHTCYSNGYLFLIDSNLYFGIGDDDPAGYWWGNFYNETFKYNLTNNQLDTLPNFPLGPSTGSCYFTINRCGYLFFGAGNMGGISALKFCPDSISAIDENPNSSVEVFPNPTNALINISDYSKLSKIEVINILGRVEHEIYEPNNAKIDLSDLNSGIYLITFTDKQKNTSTLKIIKQ